MLIKRKLSLDRHQHQYQPDNNNHNKNSLSSLKQTPTQTLIINIINHLIISLKSIGPIVFYYFLLMSLFYQVMGAARCPKIKKHIGIKLRPVNKAKEPFTPGDIILYSCESAEFTQSIKCLDDGRWSDNPHCPDPSNNTCADLGPIQNGHHNATNPNSPLKVGTLVVFRCDNNYTLDGQGSLKCLPASKWNYPAPACLPSVTDAPSAGFSLAWASVALIAIPILIAIAIVQLFIRWRRRQQQRERWKQYFTDYKYRHSKTSITFGNTRPNLHNQQQSQQNNSADSATIPVTDL